MLSSVFLQARLTENVFVDELLIVDLEMEKAQAAVVVDENGGAFVGLFSKFAF